LQQLAAAHGGIGIGGAIPDGPAQVPNSAVVGVATTCWPPSVLRACLVPNTWFPQQPATRLEVHAVGLGAVRQSTTPPHRHHHNTTSVRTLAHSPSGFTGGILEVQLALGGLSLGRAYMMAA
jgi:hypothetical protein